MDRETHFNRYDAHIFQSLYQDLEHSQDALSEYACRDKEALRRRPESFHVARPNFVKDTERILNCRFFNRYADKTQVFSLYQNDDITRRIQHVQIVSRIARTIGRMLRLNQDLIEAIALGHDIGHTPFGHAGERFLSAIVKRRTGLLFTHSVQSVRILDRLLPLNLSLQTLDGILCHNGASVKGIYTPDAFGGSAEEAFAAFEDKCARVSSLGSSALLKSSTLEGAVVRIADILAYLGKDRQDAQLLGIDIPEPFEENALLGLTNSEFIFNIVENLVTNSYGKPYICLEEEYADAIAQEKQTNYEKIYARQDREPYPQLCEMFESVYERCVQDLQSGNTDTPIWRHHVTKVGFDDERAAAYLSDGVDRVCADYIASMTDDYFMDLYGYLFPNSKRLQYRSYFSSVEA